MGFDEWNTRKKLAMVIIIITIISIVGVAILISDEITRTTENINNTTNNIKKDVINANVTINDGNTSNKTINVVKGVYKVKIETENRWTYRIATDDQYLQSESFRSQTIDLGEVKNYSSVIINQIGNGTMKVSVIDSNNNILSKSINSIDDGSVYFLLKIN